MESRGPGLLNPDLALSPTEARRVFATATAWAERGRRDGAFRRARDGHLVLFALATGARVSEVLAVRAFDVKFHSQGATVSMDRLKSKEGQRDGVRLVPRDAADLRLWMEWQEAELAKDGQRFPGNAPLFPAFAPGGRATKRGALTRFGARKIVLRLYEDAGIEHRRRAFHALRHGAGGVMQKVTGDTAAVQAKLRHTNRKDSERYSGLAEEEHDASLEAARDFLDGTVHTPTPEGQIEVLCRKCPTRWRSDFPPSGDEACPGCQSMALAWRSAA